VVVEKQAIPARPLAVVGPAIVSSSISTAESIAHLSMLEREADPHSLLRDLVDKTITFAWLAADPQPRVDAWSVTTRRSDFRSSNTFQGSGRVF
jgi:hypothetical protein